MSDEKFTESILRSHRKIVKKKVAQQVKEAKAKRAEAVKSSKLYKIRSRAFPAVKKRNKSIPFFLLRKQLGNKNAPPYFWHLFRKMRNKKDGINFKKPPRLPKKNDQGKGLSKKSVAKQQKPQQLAPAKPMPKSFAFPAFSPKQEDFLTQILTGEIGVCREHPPVVQRKRRNKKKSPQIINALKACQQEGGNVNKIAGKRRYAENNKNKAPKKRKAKKEEPSCEFEVLELSEEGSLKSFIVDDAGDGKEDWQEELAVIKKGFWRNAGTGKYDDGDIPEAGFDTIQREEKKAERLARKEDREEAKKENEEKKRKRLVKTAEM